MHDGDWASDWERPMVITPGSGREAERAKQETAAEADLLREMPELAMADTEGWRFWPILLALGVVEDVVVVRTAHVVSEVRTEKVLGSAFGVEMKLPVGASDWTRVHPDEVERRATLTPYLRGIVLADEGIVFRTKARTVVMATEGYALYVYPDVMVPPDRAGVSKLLSVRDL
jgi:hypothetical protein